MTLILSCITDSPSAHRILRCSAIWARAQGLPVRFVHIGDLDGGGRARLDEIIALETDAATSIEIHRPRPRAKVADAIYDLAAQTKADLVIIGALSRERAIRDLVGSTARRVARRAPCSVLLVSTTGRDAREWSRFIVGVDFSASSAELASTVLRVARTITARSEVCFAHEYSGEPSEPGHPAGPRHPVVSAVRMAAERYQLTNFIDGLDAQGVTASTAALPGRPGQEIARYAEDIRADLVGVVAPAKPLGFLDRLLSHPMNLLLDRLPCSVLLFRPAGATGGSST